MLLELFGWLGETVDPGFYVFQFLTFRAVISTLSALILALSLGPMIIRFMRRNQYGQTIRSHGPQSHLAKEGTPSMGGLLILGVIGLNSLLWCNLSNHYIWVILFCMVGFGILGMVDDSIKIFFKNPNGISALLKFATQSLITIAVLTYLYITSDTPQQTQLFVPFFKEVAVDLGLVFIVLGYFTIVGASNAVNITDGLDGLAIVPCILIAGALGVFAYAHGNIQISNYLNIAYLRGTSELVVVLASMIGVGLGFLWFNTYPADIFMGDVGSLALGALLAVCAVIIREEIIFLFISGMFVIETLSVMLQVASFQTRGQRIFRMAPIHHHFELVGWAEPKIIVRFWIITIVLVAIGLATLKLR